MFLKKERKYKIYAEKYARVTENIRWKDPRFENEDIATKFV